MRKQFSHLLYTSIALSITTLAMHAEVINPETAATSLTLDSVRSSVDVTLTGLHEIANIATETPWIAPDGRPEGGAVLINSSSNHADAEASAEVSDAVDPATITIVTTSSTADTIDTAGAIALGADAPPTDPSSDPGMFNTSTSTVAPEPSTFCLVGSLLLGAAVLSRKQMGRLSFSR